LILIPEGWAGESGFVLFMLLCRSLNAFHIVLLNIPRDIYFNIVISSRIVFDNANGLTRIYQG
jgi:hypothetical protein